MNAGILYEDFDDPEKGLATFPPAEACVLAASATLDSLHRTILFAELLAEHPNEEVQKKWAYWAARLSVDAERLDTQLENRDAFSELSGANPETIRRYEHSAHSHTELVFELARHHLLLILAYDAPARLQAMTDGVLLLFEESLACTPLDNLQAALTDFSSKASKIDYVRLHIDMEKELARSPSQRKEATIPPKPGEMTTTSRAQPRLKVNERMAATIAEKPEAIYWSSGEWATHLDCAASSVVATRQWASLTVVKASDKIERAKPKSSRRRQNTAITKPNEPD